MQQIKTSVIIATRNRPADIERMLKSLSIQTTHADEIIIVDSSSSPLNNNPQFNAHFNQTQFPRSTLVYKYTLPGLTYQRNIGVKFATGSVVYFFDDDVVLAPNYLQSMNNTFQNNPEYIGGMGSVKNISKYKPWVNILRAFFLLQRNYSTGSFTLSGMPTHAYGLNTFKKIKALGGCCMAYRTSLFKKELFDEALKAYGYMEDCDFSYRASRHGNLFYNPEALLDHLESPLSRDKVIDNKAMLVANYSYLFFKNFYTKNRLRIFAYAWSILGLFLEACILGKFQWLKGYVKGLRYAFKHKAHRPYQQQRHS